MPTEHRTQVRTGDSAAHWARLVGDLERFGLLGGSGACDAVARVGADILDRNRSGGPADGARDQAGAP